MRIPTVAALSGLFKLLGLSTKVDLPQAPFIDSGSELLVRTVVYVECPSFHSLFTDENEFPAGIIYEARIVSAHHPALFILVLLG